MSHSSMPFLSQKVDGTQNGAARAERTVSTALYSRYALAGGICCSLTHAVVTPIDVVKTRIQLDPSAYNRGIWQGLRHLVAHDGAQALATGFGPTVAGYFLQGACKFGGYEFFKRCIVDLLGSETASQNRNTIYLAASASAEVLGDVFLCPFEAIRIRLVSEPTYARGLLDGFKKMAMQEGVRGLYSGLGPILFKQVPYTMATFVVYEKSTELAYQSLNRSEISNGTHTLINLGSGLVAGMAAAMISQPADTMLSQINKTPAEAGEGICRRLYNIALQLGIRGSYSGIQARLVMVSGMTAGQFAIYGDIKRMIGATETLEEK